jgi:DNA-binding FrmR family transcriptional regulator
VSLTTDDSRLTTHERRLERLEGTQRAIQRHLDAQDRALATQLEQTEALAERLKTVDYLTQAMESHLARAQANEQHRREKLAAIDAKLDQLMRWFARLGSGVLIPVAAGLLTVFASADGLSDVVRRDITWASLALLALGIVYVLAMGGRYLALKWAATVRT